MTTKAMCTQLQTELVFLKDISQTRKKVFLKM